MDNGTMDSFPTDSRINLLIYFSLPPAEAQYQVEHINDSRVNASYGSMSITMALACIGVLLRFISRRLGKSAYKADDWVMVAGLVVFAGYITTIILCVAVYGGARHLILLKDPIGFAKCAMAAQCLYGMSIGLVKISTLLLFRRIFPSRGFHRLLWVFGILVLFNILTTVVLVIFQCRPIKAAWNPLIKAKCLPMEGIYMGMSGFNVFTDLLLLISPLPQLWRLQVPLRTKLELIGLFCIGGFVTIVSIYRMPSLHKISLVDGSYTDVQAAVWSAVEVSMAIVCASAITYRPLFNKIFGSRKSIGSHCSVEKRTIGGGCACGCRRKGGRGGYLDGGSRYQRRGVVADTWQHHTGTKRAQLESLESKILIRSKSVSAETRYLGTFLEFPSPSMSATPSAPPTRPVRSRSIPIRIPTRDDPEDFRTTWTPSGPPPPY